MRAREAGLVSAGAQGALRVDSVLADPLGVPRGLDQLLRRMERGAREAQARLAPLAARPDAVEAVRAAAAEVERFLDDEARSPLLRALRRPLVQIAPGRPGAQVLQRCWDGLRGRAEAAVRLQEELDVVRAAVQELRGRFEADLPRATRQVLRAERLDDESLAGVGRAQDAERLLRRRVPVALDALQELLDAADPAATAALERGARWNEEAAPGELLAVLRLRWRERARLLHGRDRLRALRLTAARQVSGLGQAGGWARPARDAVHAVAEQFAARLLRDPDGTGGGEDLALWAELLGSAADALHAPERAHGWAAQLDPPSVPEERDFGSTHFVIPIDDEYALITAATRSSVRVHDRRVTLDRTVECFAFLEEGDAESLPLARLDVAPLFEGLGDAPAWYATTQRARLQVIARHGGDWIARIVRRGTLAPSGVAAWHPARRGNDRLRVLGTLSAPPPDEPFVVGPTGEGPRGFCGVLSVPVATPLAECSTGWLRLPAGGGWTTAAVEAEETCFRTVARRSARTVPAWVGRGRLEGRDYTGPLYLPPLGLRAAELPTLRTWLFSNSGLPLLHAVAGLWLRLMDAGCGIGVYHADTLVFSLGWPLEGRPGPTAHAVVAEAPFATLLGQPHRAPPPDEALVPRYEALGCRVLPPAAARGEVALPATEAQAFALFALNALARQPLPLPGVVPAEALAEMVPDFTSHFIHPETAVRLSRALRPGADSSHVVEWIRALVGAQPG
jgi:hypothetical protein